ncbi:MAG: ribonuclease domain-containing protein [Coriobacteriia bacterium]|nr:ribonuclease domain-containing protein [Coriobacteriia bacterium]
MASRLVGVLLVLAALCLALSGCNATGASQGKAPASSSTVISSTTSDRPSDSGSITVYENGTYTSKDEVAAYIYEFGHLPSNFISKTKARKAGWVPSKGNLDEVCPGKSIGGSEFYNDDGQLPDARGRTWKECDINYSGGHRGSERIVFSNDGLVFYTPDHYRTFEQLY